MDERGRTTVAGYLIERLVELGVGHVFGVPGDFVLKLYHELARSELTVVNTCDEQGAGFAADAYARLRGFGVVCVTYGVGGLKVVNTTGQAYAEESPVLVISGAPGLDERRRHPLIHHKVRTFATQLEVFEHVTVASAVIDDPARAPGEIDRVLVTILGESLPGYLEIPRDLVGASVPRPAAPLVRPAPTASDPEALRAAVSEASRLIDAAARPVVLAGAELARFGLQADLLRFAETLRIPIATTILGKSAFSERHPMAIGVYEGAMGRPALREYVEASDCLIILGALLTDLNTGIFTARLDPERTIHVTRERLRIGGRTHERVRQADFVEGLCATCLRRPEPTALPSPEATTDGTLDPGRPLTVGAVFDRLAAVVRPDDLVVADPGDALFGAIDLPTEPFRFLSPAYYASLGFAIPAALGGQLAEPSLRPIVLVGDGAFQMTGLELSSIVRFGGNPIVILLDNDGYGTERPMIDGSFNDVLRWDYEQLPNLLGSGRARSARSLAELDDALAAARDASDSFFLIRVVLDREDASPALRRLTDALAAATRGEKPA